MTSMDFGYQETCIAVAASDAADFIYLIKKVINTEAFTNQLILAALGRERTITGWATG